MADTDELSSSGSDVGKAPFQPRALSYTLLPMHGHACTCVAHMCTEAHMLVCVVAYLHAVCKYALIYKCTYAFTLMSIYIRVYIICMCTYVYAYLRVLMGSSM